MFCISDRFFSRFSQMRPFFSRICCRFQSTVAFADFLHMCPFIAYAFCVFHMRFSQIGGMRRFFFKIHISDRLSKFPIFLETYSTDWYKDTISMTISHFVSASKILANIQGKRKTKENRNLKGKLIYHIKCWTNLF